MWQSIDSSNLKKVRYSKNILDVNFKRGGTYRYYKVPPSTYKSLLEAESKGKYFIEHIKDTYEWDKTGE
jgi:hypothetical protein